jgi:hypothetical protein
MDLCSGIIKKGTLFVKFAELSYRNEGYGHKIILPSEIVEQWQPVYAEPGFIKGEWLYYSCDEREWLFRFDKIENGKVLHNGELYPLIDNEYKENLQGKYFPQDDEITKATTEQIKRILDVVRIHKGYKKGVKYKGSCYGKIRICTEENLTYYAINDILTEGTGDSIYAKGKWADIIKEAEVVKSCSNCYYDEDCFKTECVNKSLWKAVKTKQTVEEAAKEYIDKINKELGIYANDIFIAGAHSLAAKDYWFAMFNAEITKQ